MTSCPEVIGREFGDFEKDVIWDLTGGLTVGDVGTGSIVKIVCVCVSLSLSLSLSPHVEKLKVKKLINVSYQNNGQSSVFRIPLYSYPIVFSLIFFLG